MYFESIYFKTAMEDDFALSLFCLSYFLCQKIGQSVMVLIDEYEAPINRAFKHNYLDEVRSSFL